MVVALLIIIAILLAVIAFSTRWIKVSFQVTVALIVFAVIGVFLLVGMKLGMNMIDTHDKDLFMIGKNLFIIGGVLIAIVTVVAIMTDIFGSVFKPNFDHLFKNEEDEEEDKK